ncbi:MAG: DUF2058 family protein [Pseudomonadota bacterium]
MSNSLRDQLVKAGVVTQEQADKAAAEDRKTRRSGGGGGRSDGSKGRKQRGTAGSGAAAPGADGTGGGRGAAAKGRSGNRRGRGRQGQQGSARQAQDNSPAAVLARAVEQQRGRDRRAVKALRAAVGGSEKALRDELRRFIAQYDQRSKEAADSDEPYNFVHNRKIKRIHIPVAQIEALSTGQLVIVNNDGRYALLPLGPAFTIAEVDRRRIVAAHVTAAEDPGSDQDDPTPPAAATTESSETGDSTAAGQSADGGERGASGSGDPDSGSAATNDPAAS